ncbi:MAG: hypothetical protein AAFP04_00675 [Myxococcota bacterium]
MKSHSKNNRSIHLIRCESRTLDDVAADSASNDSPVQCSAPHRSRVNERIGFTIHVGAADSLAQLVALARVAYGSSADGYELALGTFMLQMLGGPPEPGDLMVFPTTLDELFATSRFARGERCVQVLEQFQSGVSTAENRRRRLSGELGEADSEP